MAAEGGEPSGEGDLDAQIAALYRVDPEGFVAAREAMVKALRAAKRREDAKVVHGLARPTVVAWAANHVVAAQPGLLDRLVEAGAALVDAQRRAIEEGDAAGIRTAQTARRQAVAALADAGRRFLAQRDRPGAAQRDELVSLFDAAALDGGAAEALRAGRLSRAPAASSGFDPFGGVGGAPEPSTASSSPPRRGAPERATARRATKGRSAAGGTAPSDDAGSSGPAGAETDGSAARAAARRQADDVVVAARAAHHDAAAAHEAARQRLDGALQRSADAADVLARLEHELEGARAAHAAAIDEAEQARAEAARTSSALERSSAVLDEAARRRDELGGGDAR